MEICRRTAGGEADDAESRLPNPGRPAGGCGPPERRRAHHQPAGLLYRGLLVKALEDLGIGRPSTYLSIIKTIQAVVMCTRRAARWCRRGWPSRSRACSSSTSAGSSTTTLTAAMEDELDEIASGHEQRTNWLRNFYFGGEHGVPHSIARAGGLKKLVGDNVEGIDAREINSIVLFDDAHGRPITSGSAATDLIWNGWSPATTVSPPPARQSERRDHPRRAHRVGRDPFATPQEGCSASTRERSRDHRPRRPLRPVCDRGAAPAAGR